MIRPKLKEAGNSRFYGSAARVSTEREMRAFDKLPVEMRAVFREAVGDSTATGWGKPIKVLGPKVCADVLRKADRETSWLFLQREFNAEAARLITGRPQP